MNFNLGYNFAIDNDLATFESNNIKSTFKMKNISSKFNFIETNVRWETQILFQILHQ